MADGQPIDEAVADQAAQWLTLLMSGEATDDDRQRWRQWRAAQPEHDRAWRHIEKVIGQLKLMQPGAAYKALSPYANSGRRTVVRALLWFGMAGSVGLLASRTQTWQLVAADYRTGTGEQHDVALADGTHATLNTASAIDVRFDDRQRLVRLVAGEILIVTGHTGEGRLEDTRPFVVETAEGRIRAMGTRFTVRQHNGHTQVAVLESAVEITPHGAAGESRVLRTGERAVLTQSAVGVPEAADERASAWVRSQIVADNMRLEEFMAELGRYRPGIVRCDPAAADLRLSGVFPLHDTDRILTTLPSVLPVRVTLRTRYWVMVEAAP